MKKIIWSLLIIGIVGSFISIFFFGEQPIVMVSFFGFYLLLIYGLFTYNFEHIRVKKLEILNEENMIMR